MEDPLFKVNFSATGDERCSAVFLKIFEKVHLQRPNASLTFHLRQSFPKMGGTVFAFFHHIGDMWQSFQGFGSEYQHTTHVAILPSVSLFSSSKNKSSSSKERITHLDSAYISQTRIQKIACA